MSTPSATTSGLFLDGTRNKSIKALSKDPLTMGYLYASWKSEISLIIWNIRRKEYNGMKRLSRKNKILDLLSGTQTYFIIIQDSMRL